jgi:hypothetical protein
MNDALTLSTFFSRGNLKTLAAPGLIIVILSMTCSSPSTSPWP